MAVVWRELMHKDGVAFLTSAAQNNIGLPSDPHNGDVTNISEKTYLAIDE